MNEMHSAPATDVRIVEEADGITYRLGRMVDPAAIAAVYRSVGWTTIGADPNRLGESLMACSEVASAWDGDEAVGVARVLSDHHFHAVITGVAVRADRQGKGIGSRMVEHLMNQNPNLHYHLWTRSRRFSFYSRLGFEPEDTAMHRLPPARPK